MLSREFPSRTWVAALVIALGVAAAVGETLSVGLAVILLFSLLREKDQITEAGGLLSEVYLWVESLFGGNLWLISGVFLGLILFTALLFYANQALTGVILNRVAERMRDSVHRVYVRVGYDYLQRRDHGALLHTLTTASWTVSEAFVSIVRIAVNACAVGVFGIGLFLLSWQLGLAALAGALVVFFLLKLISRPVRRLGERTLEANRTLAERMLISMHGMRTLRVYALEDFMLDRFDAASATVRRRATRMEVVKAAIGPLNQISGLGILLLFVIVGGFFGVSAATIIAAVLLLFRLQPYMQEIEAHRVALAGMGASLRDVREAIEVEGKPFPATGGATFEGLREALRFEAVSFSHDPRKAPSLDAVSFSIPAGRTTALLGPSGSGKTTILNMILRLYEPDSGAVMADGRDIAGFSRASWLGKVAIAGQDVDFLEGTVLQNILVARPDADMDRVREACRWAEILDDLEGLPDGLDTRIGANGMSFSGGQRQRIGLARAFLRDPDVLLLDEAMSALEADREIRIRERIVAHMRGRTVIVVSHRTNTIEMADHVVRIAGGRVVADAPRVVAQA